MKEMKKNLFEFLRYVLIGGSAFLVDLLIMVLFNEFVFKGNFLYVSIFLGYVVGLIYNFIFSCRFVFENGFEKIKNNEVKSFVIFTVIGLLGLGLTELLMFLFVDLIDFHYTISKILTGIIVVFWNYLARKFIIFS